jgi:cytidylate kinase
LEIKLEDRETVVYINGKKTNCEELQSEKTSIAVSAISSVANNEKMYAFGKTLIDSFREKYNVILSSRDIMKMYPDTTYHFFLTADLEERINRKYIQYKGKVPKEQIRDMIVKRDKLQEEAGYYKIYDNTQIVDVTNCNTVEEACKKLLQYIGEERRASFGVYK